MVFDISSNYQWVLIHYLNMLYKYVYQAQLYVYHKLNSFAHVYDEYFSRKTVTFWIIAITLIWSAIYTFYTRIISVILKRMTLPALQRNRLTKSLWHCGFYIGTIILCIMTIIMHESKMSNTFDFYSKNSFVCEEMIPTHLLFSCVVIFAFFMQSIILTSIQKGIEVEFFEKGLFMTLLYIAYSLRYIWLMLTVLILIGISSVSVEFMKISYCLNRGRTVKSSFLRNCTCLMFGIHCILWVGIFMYILPKYYLMPSINASVPDKDVKTLCLLCGALWTYFSIEIYCAPITKLIWYCIWPDHSYGRRDWLDYVLFPPRNDVIEHLKQIRSKTQSQQAKSVQCDGLKEENKEKERSKVKAKISDNGSASNIENNKNLD